MFKDKAFLMGLFCSFFLESEGDGISAEIYNSFCSWLGVYFFGLTFYIDSS